MALGLESPILKYLLSHAQAEATNAPVNSMGLGVQSTAQRKASGNKFQTVTERQRAKAAKKKVVAPGLAKAKAKSRGKAKGRPDTVPANPPVQLPELPNDDLGLASELT